MLLSIYNTIVGRGLTNTSTDRFSKSIYARTYICTYVGIWELWDRWALGGFCLGTWLPLVKHPNYEQRVASKKVPGNRSRWSADGLRRTWCGKQNSARLKPVSKAKVKSSSWQAAAVAAATSTTAATTTLAITLTTGFPATVWVWSYTGDKSRDFNFFWIIWAICCI